MQINKKATSIIEAMVVLLIVVSWVTGMYSIFTKSIKLSDSTENKLHAIEIAKQWIEGFTNIRDTNWLRFSSDIDNCWNTMNYDARCIWWSGTDIPDNWHFIIYKNTSNNWEIEEKTVPNYNYNNSNYRTEYRVWLDNKWIYTQNGTLTNLNNIINELKPIFTREIRTKYSDTNDPKLEVTSLVQWVDSSSNEIQKVELNKTLTNWKK